MPRLRQVPRSEAAASVLPVYDLLFGADRCPVEEPGTITGTPGDWWTVFALVPAVFEHACQGILLYRSPERLLDPVLRELAQTRTGWTRQSRFVFSQHCKSCRTVGISEEKIAAIPNWSATDLFTPTERAVLAYTDALTLENGRVSDGVFEALHLHLSDEEILELTYITALYEAHAIMSKALRVEFDADPDPISEIPSPGEYQGFLVGPNDTPPE
ncbi:hypothetical protein IMCC26256_111123 [Actinobacteria bacterium IMCC26256]|nr:hypothetical protein IMCC26256_111123 [Actinobacteria bacterium IMCC26256]